jgi:excisionase family DNA binding protein
VTDRTPGPTDLRPLLVTPVQAAGMLNVGRTTIYYLARDGFLTPIRIGRATRYAVDELEAYVKARGTPMIAGPARDRQAIDR